MRRKLSGLMICLLMCAACGTKTTTTVDIPFLNVPSDFTGPYAWIENGANTSVYAVNASKKFYNSDTLGLLEKQGVGNAVAGDPTDTQAEVDEASAMVEASKLKMLIGPATWAPNLAIKVGGTARHWCTDQNILCISGAADSVRDTSQDIYSFTTAGFSPGFTGGVAYDMKQAGNSNIVLLTDWDTSAEVPYMQQWGVNVLASVVVPSDDPGNWPSDGNASASAVASQILSYHPDAVLLDCEPTGDVAVFLALVAQGYDPNRTWLGSESDIGTFVAGVGPNNAAGLNNVIDTFYDPNSPSYTAWLAQFSKWNNNTPTSTTWEVESYWAATLSAYTVHAAEIAAKATSSTVLTGETLRTTLLNLTQPPASANATKYYISDTANILAALDAGKPVDLEGFGLPFSFTSSGRGLTSLTKIKVGAGGVLNTTTISPEVVLNAIVNPLP